MSKPLQVGNVALGGGAPVTIQSMCNTATEDVAATVAQIHVLEAAGCEIVRVAVPTMEAAQAIGKIKSAIHIPLVADIHFDYKLALECAAQGVDKIRINPGNIGAPERVRAVADACRERGIPIRVGVNGGSLEKEMLQKYGGVTAEALVESAMGHVKLLNDCNFDDICLSVKCSHVPTNMAAYRLLAERTDYPLHLGVTEAGNGIEGRIKSAVGIGALLADGVGDTIRVSLTEAPENEVPVAQMLVDHFQSREGEFEVLHPERYSPTEYRRRTSAPIIAHSEITDNYIVIDSTSENPTAEWRAAILNADHDKPVVIRRHYEGAKEEVALYAAADMGQLLLDGLADGVWIDAPQIADAELHEIELIILQASRARFSQTEYIACPSCGRTLYNIEQALADIKARTSHLKGLKIGVMGCIVNGPGEMADADYGYVGAGAGRISLYKGKECIERNIPQEEALERLIELIKANGDWKEKD